VTGAVVVDSTLKLTHPAAIWVESSVRRLTKIIGLVAIPRAL